jgi:hypothetical protein
MAWKKAARVALPILIVIAAVSGLCIRASLSYERAPHAKNGVLNLSEWNQNGAFEVTASGNFVGISS